MDLTVHYRHYGRIYCITLRIPEAADIVATAINAALEDSGLPRFHKSPRRSVFQRGVATTSETIDQYALRHGLSDVSYVINGVMHQALGRGA